MPKQGLIKYTMGMIYEFQQYGPPFIKIDTDNATAECPI